MKSKFLFLCALGTLALSEAPFSNSKTALANSNGTPSITAAAKNSAKTSIGAQKESENDKLESRTGVSTGMTIANALNPVFTSKHEKFSVSNVKYSAKTVSIKKQKTATINGRILLKRNGKTYAFRRGVIKCSNDTGDFKNGKAIDENGSFTLKINELTSTTTLTITPSTENATQKGPNDAEDIDIFNVTDQSNLYNVIGDIEISNLIGGFTYGVDITIDLTDKNKEIFNNYFLISQYVEMGADFVADMQSTNDTHDAHVNVFYPSVIAGIGDTAFTGAAYFSNSIHISNSRDDSSTVLHEYGHTVTAKYGTFNTYGLDTSFWSHSGSENLIDDKTRWYGPFVYADKDAGVGLAWDESLSNYFERASVKYMSCKLGKTSFTEKYPITFDDDVEDWNNRHYIGEGNEEDCAYFYLSLADSAHYPVKIGKNIKANTIGDNVDINLGYKAIWHLICDNGLKNLSSFVTELYKTYPTKIKEIAAVQSYYRIANSNLAYTSQPDVLDSEFTWLSGCNSNEGYEINKFKLQFIDERGDTYCTIDLNDSDVSKEEIGKYSAPTYTDENYYDTVVKEYKYSFKPSFEQWEKIIYGTNTDTITWNIIGYATKGNVTTGPYYSEFNIINRDEFIKGVVDPRLGTKSMTQMFENYQYYRNFAIKFCANTTVIGDFYKPGISIIGNRFVVEFGDLDFRVVNFKNYYSAIVGTEVNYGALTSNTKLTSSYVHNQVFFTDTTKNAALTIAKKQSTFFTGALNSKELTTDTSDAKALSISSTTYNTLYGNSKLDVSTFTVDNSDYFGSQAHCLEYSKISAMNKGKTCASHLELCAFIDVKSVVRQEQWWGSWSNKATINTNTQLVIPLETLLTFTYSDGTYGTIDTGFANLDEVIEISNVY